jgi:hypothetical protein
MATHSFDCVNIWSLDFNASKNTMQILFKQQIVEENVLSVLILPANRFLVLGTKEGDILLYDINQNIIC